MGTHEAYLSTVLRGKNRPRLATYRRFAGLLGVPLEAILGLPSAPAPPESRTAASFPLPFRGSVAAGPFSPSRMAPPDEAVDLGAGFPSDAFALRVTGHSVAGAGVGDGDLLVVAPADGARDGRLLVARGDNGYTLLGCHGGGLYAFWSAAGRPARIPADSGAEGRIVGVVVRRIGEVVCRPAEGRAKKGK